MTIHDDPKGIEVKKLLRHVPLKGKEVLEIGCGEGRLTFKYHSIPKRLVAIDSLSASIRSARKRLPENGGKVEFRVGKAEDLPFKENSFDVALFTWSLCCIDIPAMGRALNEAWRVLKPGGTLANLQPSLFQPFGKGMVSYLIQGQFGTTVDDDRYRQARLALKYVSLIEGKFDLMHEEEFSVPTYYDNYAEALADFVIDLKNEYRTLSRSDKARVREGIESLRTPNGIRVVDNVVLTVLSRKGQPAK